MNAQTFTLSFHSNGQVSINTDKIAMHNIADANKTGRSVRSVFLNDGMAYRGCDPAATVAAMRAAFPTATVRKLKDGVKILWPAAIVAARDEVNRKQAEWATELGYDYRAVVNRVINDPTYRAHAA